MLSYFEDMLTAVLDIGGQASKIAEVLQRSCDKINKTMQKGLDVTEDVTDMTNMFNSVAEQCGTAFSFVSPGVGEGVEAAMASVTAGTKGVQQGMDTVTKTVKEFLRISYITSSWVEGLDRGLRLITSSVDNLKCGSRTCVEQGLDDFKESFRVLLKSTKRTLKRMKSVGDAVEVDMKKNNVRVAKYSLDSAKKAAAVTTLFSVVEDKEYSPESFDKKILDAI